MMELSLELREEKICGEDFINLSENQLKEMFPIMGEQMKVSRVQKDLKGEGEVQLEVSMHSWLN